MMISTQFYGPLPRWKRRGQGPGVVQAVKAISKDDTFHFLPFAAAVNGLKSSHEPTGTEENNLEACHFAVVAGVVY